MSTPTTNRRVYMDSPLASGAPTSPSKSSGRRALGEITPNAKISSFKSSIAPGKSSTPVNLSPLKQTYTAPSLADENAIASAQQPLTQPTGRKRSIHEVDGAVARENASGAAQSKRRAEYLEAQPSGMLRDDTTPSLAAQIVELDKRDEDASSTDEDTIDEPPATQQTTGTRASFSSLIDYNPTSSQQASSSPPLPATTLKANPVKTVCEPLDERESATGSAKARKQQAETLRLRLRVALYKVRTNQTSVPMSRLEIPKQYQRKATTPSMQPSMPAQPIPSITVSPTKAPEASKLLPAPLLRPTPYSARHIMEPYMPSSPPNTVGIDSNATPRAAPQNPHDFETPVNRRGIGQLSSPPGSEEQGGRQRAHTDSDSLTSSVVKGRAASGLLELMRSA